MFLKKFSENRASEELLSFILSLRIKMLSGMKIEKAFIEAGKNTKGWLSEETERIEKELKRGASFEEALANSLLRNKNRAYRKAIVYIAEVYRAGGKNAEKLIEILCKDLANGYQIRLKRNSAKLSMLSMVFIVLSAVAPALWLAFATIASFLMASEITQSEIIFVGNILFPIASFFVIFHLSKII